MDNKKEGSVFNGMANKRWREGREVRGVGVKGDKN